jgi:mono/diheme cytochrome c family protein
MNTEDNVELDETQKIKRGGLVAMVKWPLITTVAIVSFIWIVFSVLPPESGWHFGMRFKLFFSLFAIAGGLFFIFLKVGPMPPIRSQGKALASIAAVFLVIIGALVTLGFVLPQYEIPKGIEEVVVVSAQERGRELFQDPAVGCYLCHSIGGVGATRGPELSRIGEIGAARRPGLSLEEYLRESIIDPTAYIAADYPPIMPTNFGDRLTEEQIEDLIAFLKSLR